MLTLRIFMIDLIAFVPDGGGLWALLPEARKEKVLNETTIESHFPVVLFDTDEEDAGDWDEVKPKLNLFGERRGRIWLLEREEVRISAQILSDPLTLGANTPPGVLPNSGSREDAAWIPRMQNIAPAAAQVDPACLASPTNTNRIVARMRIPAGLLRTVRFAGTRTPSRIRPFTFRTGASTPAIGSARAIADAVVVDLRVGDSAVVFESVGLEDGAPRRQFTLTPRGNSRVVNVLLGNLSPLNPAQPDETSGPHFARYYDLSAQAVQQRPIPFVEPNGGFVQSIKVNTRKTPLFLRQIHQARLGAINRQICTFAMLSA